ncbi:hypothetical protein BD309DRAFT_958685 [Dichomitus squalens]|uniref:Uncharacterized protein n=1 Tax=Dichomitus squalens TaxID=114155 RepID=A0A4Q9QDC8_9APHY|nr:hypothetical protein BD309DRAFT_958685 [Dichomitus squalens]TBU65216.1 hypothetical protein BD310DRAFT_914275 [Dichomitus squalens]
MPPVEHSRSQPGAVVTDPLLNANFTLDSSGVAGFFGGDTAVHGMATVNLFRGRRWGGLYNTPGSLEIAKRYGQLANARVCKGLFPGGTDDPSQLFGLDGKVGPRFLAARSGSRFEKTGHLAALLARMARRAPYESVYKNRGKERITTPATVTIIDLPYEPPDTVQPELPYNHSALLAFVPIGASIGACVGCALVADWWSFSNILLGMFANGCACFVLGSGRLTFKHHRPASGAPPGDGIFRGETGVIVVRGGEGAVNALTRGRFFLQYEAPAESCRTQGKVAENRDGQAEGSQAVAQLPRTDDSLDGDMEKQVGENQAEEEQEAGRIAKEAQERERKARDTDTAPQGGQPNSFAIGLCSILLTAQFLVQLLLVPQGVLFGQVMFVCTLAVSWGYNTYLSSIDREDIQTKILCKILKLEDKNIRKFEFGTWTAMSIFALLALQPKDPLPNSPKILDDLLPNDTEVWAKWKDIMREKMGTSGEWQFTDDDRKLRKQEPTDVYEKQQCDKAQELLVALIEDAKAANERFRKEYPKSPRLCE